MLEKSWSEERIAMLARLHKAGFTYSQIAKKLTERTEGPSLSRNACIGKATRLGIEQSRTDKTVTKLAAHTAGGLAFRMTRARKEKRLGPPVVKVDLPVEMPPPPQFLGLSFEQLRSSQCRFPQGDAPFTFCGADRNGKGPYCDHHMQIAYVKPAERKVVQFKRVAGSRPTFRYDGAAA